MIFSVLGPKCFISHVWTPMEPESEINLFVKGWSYLLQFQKPDTENRRNLKQLSILHFVLGCRKCNKRRKVESCTPDGPGKSHTIS